MFHSVMQHRVIRLAIKVAVVGATTLALLTMAVAPVSAQGTTTGWSQVQTGPRPLWGGSAMAYYPATGSFPGGMVVFGDYGSTDDTSVLTDQAGVWNWQVVAGPACSASCSAQDPPAVQGASLAYDAAAGAMVAFGGYNNAYNITNDTWALQYSDGTGWQWSQVADDGPDAGCVTTCSGPTIRMEASMAYDPSAQVLPAFVADAVTV
jgi:hypothetical protein